MSKNQQQGPRMPALKFAGRSAGSSRRSNTPAAASRGRNNAEGPDSPVLAADRSRYGTCVVGAVVALRSNPRAWADFLAISHWRETFCFFFPLTTCLLLGIVFCAVVALLANGPVDCRRITDIRAG